MKKVLMMIAFASLLCVGCSKDTEVKGNEAEFYTVKFNVSTFNTEIKPLSKSYAPNDSALVQTLAYVVCDTSNKALIQVKYKLRDSITNQFEEISESLPKGQYFVHFVGSPEKNNIGCLATNSSGAYSMLNQTDLLAKSIVLDVTNSNTQPVLLKRVVGRLDVVIMDIIPASVSRIEIYLSSVAYMLHYQVRDKNYISHLYLTRNFYLTPDMRGVANNILPIYTLTEDYFRADETQVTITAYDSANNPLSVKHVENVKVFINYY